MKRILIALLALIMMLSLSACHKHRWEPATCEDPQTCSVCGKTKGDPLGHAWGEPGYEWSEDFSSVTASRVCANDPSHVESETVETTAEVKKEATCTEAGETTFSAVFQNPIFAAQSRDEALPAALGHSWGESVYEWSDDLSSISATRVCENDPAHVETEIADVTAEVTKPASCEEPGETTYSAVFGNEAFAPQSRTEADIPALGHSWGETSYEWSDDLSSVTATRVCENDPAHVETETVQTTVEIIAGANCDEPGKVLYTGAFSFGDSLDSASAEEDVAAIGHVWGEPVYEWAADLSSVTATRTCEHDPAHVETETVQTTVTQTVAPGCESAGENTYLAHFENAAFADQIRIEADVAAIGHDWGETSYEWADDLSSLTATRVCRNDPAHVETETVTVSAEVTKPAVCEEAGETTYSAAFVNEAFAAQSRTETDIPARGHDWGEPVYEWADDLSSLTATRICRNDPAHIETETVTVSAEVTTPATCTEMGCTTYSAAFVNEAFAAQSRTETDIPALGHDWLKATHTQPATCSVCGETEGEPLPIHYFDMRFKEYRHVFNRSYPAFLRIDDGGRKEGFLLKILGDKIPNSGLDQPIHFYHADEFYPGPRTSRNELKHFNLIEISYVDDSGSFDTSISARIAQLGYYAAKILDPDLGMTAFFKEGLDLFDAKGNEQFFTHNGFVYKLSCLQDGGSYRYVFTMTLEENLE